MSNRWPDQVYPRPPEPRPPRPPQSEAAINETVLSPVLARYRLIIRPYTYQGTARMILHDLAEQGYVLMHRDDL